MFSVVSMIDLTQSLHVQGLHWYYGLGQRPSTCQEALEEAEALLETNPTGLKAAYKNILLKIHPDKVSCLVNNKNQPVFVTNNSVEKGRTVQVAEEHRELFTRMTGLFVERKKELYDGMCPPTHCQTLSTHR